MRWLKWIVMASLATVLALASVPVLAQPADCTKDANGSDEEDPLKACEVKLNTAQGDLLFELNALIDEVETTPGMNLANLRVVDARTGEESDIKEHMAKLGRQHGRADDAIAESANEDFEEFVAQGGKEKGQKCEWKEAEDVQKNPDNYLPTDLTDPSSNLGNTDCDKFTAYDPDKDRRVTISERSQPNICVRVCQDKDVPGQPGTKKKDKIRGRHVNRRSEAIDATERAADAVFKARQDLVTMNVMADTFGPDFAFAAVFPECELPSDVPQIAAWGTKAVLSVVLVVLKLNSRVSDGAKDAATAACYQTVAGFNLALVCIPVIVAHQINLGLVDAVDFLIQAADVTSEGFEIFTGDATHACVKSIKSDTDIVKADTAILKQQSAGLQASVDELKDTVALLKILVEQNRDLLLTPQGRRDEFPLK